MNYNFLFHLLKCIKLLYLKVMSKKMWNFTLEETQFSKNCTAFIVSQRQINDDIDHIKKMIKSKADGSKELENQLTTIYLSMMAKELIRTKNVYVPCDNGNDNDNNNCTKIIDY
jgi:hypothetical protein